MLTASSPADKDQRSQRRQRRQERTCTASEVVTNGSPSSGIEVKGKARKKKNKNAVTSRLYDWHTRRDWHTLCVNTHVGTHTGTVLHLDVCRWELRWQCAASKENLTCSVNGAGSGRLAINLIWIEDSDQPLNAARTLTVWPDLWRPANYLHQ